LNNLVLLAAVISLTLCSSCSTDDTINSQPIIDQQERIDILSKEITVFSVVLDAEYNLYRTGGFSSFKAPALGPTDVDYKFVVKVQPLDVNKWISKDLKAIPISQSGDSWMHNLVSKRKNNWVTTSNPEFYTTKQYVGPNFLKVVYRKEGIIYSYIELN